MSPCGRSESAILRRERFSETLRECDEERVGGGEILPELPSALPQGQRRVEVDRKIAEIVDRGGRSLGGDQAAQRVPAEDSENLEDEEIRSDKHPFAREQRLSVVGSLFANEEVDHG